MINRKEFLQLSENIKVQPFVIDKDWILGHFLNAYNIVKKFVKQILKNN